MITNKDYFCPIHNLKMQYDSMELPLSEFDEIATDQFDHGFLSSGQFHRTTEFKIKEEKIFKVKFICPNGCILNAVDKEVIYYQDRKITETIG